MHRVDQRDHPQQRYEHWGSGVCSCSGLTTAYFLGNAPSMGSQVFYQCASSFSVCYTAGATGFTTPTWCPVVNDICYPAAVCGATTSSTTTVPSTTTTTPPTVIELSSFTATPYTRQVILKWSTESETDNAGFNIYRSRIRGWGI